MLCAYNDINNTLSGEESTDAVKTVVAAQILARTYDWFTPSVKDIRMLRIEDSLIIYLVKFVFSCYNSL